MEKDEIGADKDGMKNYWEFTTDVLEFLGCYLEKRREELEEALDDLNTEDPYLLGFQNGFKAGFKAAADLTMIACTKASAGQYMLNSQEYRQIAFGMKCSDAPGQS